MGGAIPLVSTVFSTVMGLAQKNDRSDSLAKERAAREAEQLEQEAEDRARDRAKVVEARELEDKRKQKSLLSQGAASLEDDAETTAAKLKTKLGE